MFKLVVNIDKLNIRNTPFADPSFENWVGDCSRNEVIFAESKVDDLKDTTIKWYKDSHNRFYWEGGLTVVSSEPRVRDIPAALTAPNSWWQQDKYKIRELWKESKGEGVVVAIIDSGIDMQNRFLNSRVDVVNSKSYWDKNTNITDNFFHGTHCAGLIASAEDSDFFGIAPAAKLVIAKVTDEGSIFNELIIAALTDLIKIPEVDIISMSLQIENKNDAMNDLFIKAATEHNKIIICPVGNNDNDIPVKTDVYPAALSRDFPIISISSCEQNGEYSKFNYLFPATTSCPGNDIYSFCPGLVKKTKRGSSQANAVATGIVALLVGYMKKNNLKVSPQAIKDILLSSSVPTQSEQFDIVFNTLTTTNIFNLSKLHT